MAVIMATMVYIIYMYAYICKGNQKYQTVFSHRNRKNQTAFFT